MTKRSWTKDRVIRELMRLKEELGRTPVRRDDGGLAWAAQKYFGSWNEAKEAAGLKMTEKGRKLKWTKKKVVEDLKSLKEELGRTPVGSDDRRLAAAARRLFGSWNEAKEVAGLETYRYPTGESPLEMKLLKLLDEKGVVTRSEAVERLGCKRNSISKVLRRSDDISGVWMSTGRTGDIKYKSSKLFRSDTPRQLIYRDPIEVGEYMEDLFKFELSPRIERGKKIAITRFLQGHVPEETLDYLRSLYTKG